MKPIEPSVKALTKKQLSENIKNRSFPFSLFHSSVLLTEQQIVDLYLAINTEFSASDLGDCWDFAIWYDYDEGRCIRIGDYLYREK